MTHHPAKPFCTKSHILGTVMGVVLAGVVFLPIDMYLGYRSLMAQLDSTEIKNVFIPDKQLGWKPKPDSIGLNRSPGNFDVRYHIDKNGFKTVPFKDSAKIRIFIFGDSYTFGHGVKNGDTYANIMAADYLKPTVKIVNCGVTGYGLTQMYGRLLEVADRIKPGDIVLFAPISSNLRRNWDDFVFVGQFIFFKKQLNVSYFPWFSKGKLEAVPLDAISNRLKTLLFYARFSGRLFQHLHRLVFAADPIPEAKAIIGAARAITRQKGARFVLIFLPSSTECIKKRYDLDISGFDYIDVRDRFPDTIEGIRKITFPSDPHWNPKGHALVAEIIINTLAANKILPPQYLRNLSRVKASF